MLSKRQKVLALLLAWLWILKTLIEIIFENDVNYECNNYHINRGIRNIPAKDIYGDMLIHNILHIG